MNLIREKLVKKIKYEYYYNHTVKEMNDRITISITPELHNAIMIASEEKDISISRTIENALRDSSDFRKFVEKAKKYSELEQNIYPNAVSPALHHILSKTETNPIQEVENKI